MSVMHLKQKNKELREEVDRLRRERNQAWAYISTLNMIITLLEKEKVGKGDVADESS